MFNTSRNWAWLLQYVLRCIKSTSLPGTKHTYSFLILNFAMTTYVISYFNFSHGVMAPTTKSRTSTFEISRRNCVGAVQISGTWVGRASLGSRRSSILMMSAMQVFTDLPPLKDSDRVHSKLQDQHRHNERYINSQTWAQLKVLAAVSVPARQSCSHCEG